VYTEKWYYGENLTYLTNGTITYEYGEKISATVFAREQISPERMKETVDVTTREILSGPGKGAYTSHWIRIDYSIGGPVTIADHAVMVRAKNIDINLPSVTPEKGGAQISCFELEYKGEMTDFTFTDLFYYDMKTGIKVSQTTNSVFIPDPNGTIQTTLILEETQTDNDEDGLTDLEELFVTLTNPLKTDSDYDFWSDPIDTMPNNVLVPNGLIVLLVVIPIVSVVWWWKKRRAKVEKPPTVPAQPAYPPPQLTPQQSSTV